MVSPATPIAGKINGQRDALGCGFAAGNQDNDLPLPTYTEGEMDAAEYEKIMRDYMNIGMSAWPPQLNQADFANAYRSPRQKKIDAAREYLKSRAHAHPEWSVKHA